MPIHVCKNPSCTAGNNGGPLTSPVHLDWSPFCSDECRSAALGVPMRRDLELREALRAELLTFRQREDSDPVKVEAWVWHVAGIASAALPAGRLAGNKSELPDWPEKPHAEASAEAKRLSMYREVTRAVVRDFAEYTFDADRRRECEARRVALALDYQGLRDAEKVAEEALEWHWQENDPLRNLEYGCEMAEMRYRREERERRQRPPRNPRLTGERPLYDV